MTARAPVGPAERDGSADHESADPVATGLTLGPGDQRPATGPIDWAAGLVLGMLVGATAPNTETLQLRLPLSHLLPSLSQHNVIASVMLYTGDILACLGLAGMLWAHSQGWRPNPRHLLLASAGIVTVMVSLTPVGSSDTASYAAYGRIGWDRTPRTPRRSARCGHGSRRCTDHSPP